MRDCRITRRMDAPRQSYNGTWNMTPSLNPRVRAIINEFNRLFIPGSNIRSVFSTISKKHNISFYDFKKLLETELGVKIGSSKEFRKKIYKAIDNDPKITYATNIENENKLGE